MSSEPTTGRAQHPHDPTLEELAATLEQLVRAYEARVQEELAELEQQQPLAVPAP